jgi:aminoglycoside/choline kinase family phosphotransferase
MVDHGLQDRTATTEAEAFVAIGNHLKGCGVPVPEIYQAEPFSGLVFMEDLGDTHLQSVVRQCHDLNEVDAWYRQVIDILIAMWSRARENFDSAWTWQTARYDKKLIIEQECHYFVEAFLKDYLGLKVDVHALETDFSKLADRTEQYACEGFMHRDLQSRNIMVKQGRLYLIDFQGGRIGPLQYDLASLLIDPYVDLPSDLQDDLQRYCCEQAFKKTAIDPGPFNDGYACCRLTRNLQMLGAFGFLSNRKQKTYFAQYIPVAVRTLNQSIRAFDPGTFPRLSSVIGAIL